MQRTTSDGLVTVDAPDGDDWRLDDMTTTVEGNTISGFKCKRTTAGVLFFMIAKDYTVPLEHASDPETLLRNVYPQLYAKMFTEVKIDMVRDFEFGGHEWWEAGYQFKHASMGLIAKLERVTVVRDHVLLTSVEGRQSDVRANVAVAKAWMDRAVFVTK